MEASNIFAIHAQDTRQYLEQLRVKINSGRLYSAICLFTNTPVNEAVQEHLIRDHFAYLYNLHQHRNILHYILACLTDGKFGTAKVSLHKLANTDINPLKQWIAKRVSLSRSWLASELLSQEYTRLLFDIFGATSSVCNTWYTQEEPTLVPFGPKYIRIERDPKKSSDLWNQARASSKDFIPSLVSTWPPLRSK